MPTKILIADHEKKSQMFLGDILERHGYDVIPATTCDEVLEKIRYKPNLIALEVLLPDRGGWELARQLKGERVTSAIPIVFVTSNDSDVDEIVGFELGAVDYIKKPIHEGIFLARLRSILRNQEENSATARSHFEIFQIEDLEIDVGNYTVKVGDLEIHFTKKEIELLTFLVKNRGKVLQRSILLKTLWGEKASVNDRTLDVHIRKIREKLGDYHRFITTVKKVGYKFNS